MFVSVSYNKGNHLKQTYQVGQSAVSLCHINTTVIERYLLRKVSVTSLYSKISSRVENSLQSKMVYHGLFIGGNGGG